MSLAVNNSAHRVSSGSLRHCRCMCSNRCAFIMRTIYCYVIRIVQASGNVLPLAPAPRDAYMCTVLYRRGCREGHAGTQGHAGTAAEQLTQTQAGTEAKNSSFNEAAAYIGVPSCTSVPHGSGLRGFLNRNRDITHRVSHFSFRHVRAVTNPARSEH